MTKIHQPGGEESLYNSAPSVHEDIQTEETVSDQLTGGYTTELSAPVSNEDEDVHLADVNFLRDRVSETLSDTAVSAVEQPAPPPSLTAETYASTKKEWGWGQKTAAAISLALAGLGFAGAATAAEPVPGQTSVAQTGDREVAKTKEVSPEKIEQAVKAYVGGLGMFKKIALANDIKANAGAIRGVLDRDLSGSKELLTTASTSLLPILNMYISALTEMKTVDQVKYAQMKGKLEHMVTMVETTPLTELQAKL